MDRAKTFILDKLDILRKLIGTHSIVNISLQNKQTWFGKSRSQQQNCTHIRMHILIYTECNIEMVEGKTLFYSSKTSKIK